MAALKPVSTPRLAARAAPADPADVFSGYTLVHDGMHTNRDDTTLLTHDPELLHRDEAIAAAGFRQRLAMEFVRRYGPRMSTLTAQIADLCEYYRLFRSRVDLESKWKYTKAGTRLAKLRGALAAHVDGLPLPAADRASFLDDCIKLVEVSWVSPRHRVWMQRVASAMEQQLAAQAEPPGKKRNTASAPAAGRAAALASARAPVSAPALVPPPQRLAPAPAAVATTAAAAAATTAGAAAQPLNTTLHLEAARAAQPLTAKRKSKAKGKSRQRTRFVREFRRDDLAGYEQSFTPTGPRETPYACECGSSVLNTFTTIKRHKLKAMRHRQWLSANGLVPPECAQYADG